MFDLDQAIVEWRRGVVDAGLCTPEVLDELEGHLRDDVEQQVRSGLKLEDAFEVATRQLGGAKILKSEFRKIGGLRAAPERIRYFVQTLAGIPSLTTSMNTTYTNVEPRWATYVKASTFLIPAVLLWFMSVLFVLPKLEQISLDAGGFALPSIIRIPVALTRHGVLIWAVIVALLVLLEWRAKFWPKYRRAVVGLGTFILNAAVLVSIFMMVVSALLYIPTFMKAARTAQQNTPPAAAQK